MSGDFNGYFEEANDLLPEFSRFAISKEVMDLLIEALKSGKRVPMFFYGTLRKTGYNHGRFNEVDVKIRQDATTPGQLYFPGHRMYPGARFDEEGTIVGDLMWYPIAHPLVSIFGMEIGAGYTAEIVPVTYEKRSRPRRKTIDAISFQYEGRWGREDWTPVPGNNWLCPAAIREHR